MSKTLINASFNFTKKPFTRAVAGHISRNPKHVDNPNVSTAYSEYNYSYHIANKRYHRGRAKGSYDDMLRAEHILDIKHWGKYLQDRNKKYQNHPNQQKSLKQLLSSKPKKKRLSQAIFTLGHNARQLIDEKVTRYYQLKHPHLTTKDKVKVQRKIKRTYTNSFKNFMYNFNKYHKFIKALGYGINVDETKRFKGSAPHVHVALYANGFTKSGNPSANLDRGLQMEAERIVENSPELQRKLNVKRDKNGNIKLNHKKALSIFAQHEDKHLLKAVNYTFKEHFGIDLQLQYTPTGSKVKNLSMKHYKLWRKSRQARLSQFEREMIKEANGYKANRKRNKTYAQRAYSNRSYYTSTASSASQTASDKKHSASSYSILADSYSTKAVDNSNAYAKSSADLSGSYSAALHDYHSKSATLSDSANNQQITLNHSLSASKSSFNSSMASTSDRFNQSMSKANTSIANRNANLNSQRDYQKKVEKRQADKKRELEQKEAHITELSKALNEQAKNISDKLNKLHETLQNDLTAIKQARERIFSKIDETETGFVKIVKSWRDKLKTASANRIKEIKESAHDLLKKGSPSQDADYAPDTSKERKQDFNDSPEAQKTSQDVKNVKSTHIPNAQEILKKISDDKTNNLSRHAFMVRPQNRVNKRGQSQVNKHNDPIKEEVIKRKNRNKRIEQNKARKAQNRGHTRDDGMTW